MSCIAPYIFGTRLLLYLQMARDFDPIPASIPIIIVLLCKNVYEYDHDELFLCYASESALISLAVFSYFIISLIELSYLIPRTEDGRYTKVMTCFITLYPPLIFIYVS